MGKPVPTWLGTRDITQLAVSVPALVLGGWTKGWGGESQAREKVGQPFMVLPPYPSPYSATRPWPRISIFRQQPRPPPSSKALAPHLSQMLTGPFKWLAVHPSPTQLRIRASPCWCRGPGVQSPESGRRQKHTLKPAELPPEMSSPRHWPLDNPTMCGEGARGPAQGKTGSWFGWQELRLWSWGPVTFLS